MKTKAIFFALSLLLCLLGPVGADKQKYVLVLYADSRLLPGIALFDEAFRSELNDVSGDSINLMNEFLDIDRHPSETYKTNLAKFLELKYKKIPVDVVVVVRSPTLKFVLENRRIFPKSPVVYAAASQAEIKTMKLPADVVGVPISFEPDKLIETALELHPGTKQITVINGNSPHDNFWLDLEHKAFLPFEKKVHFDYWSGLPMVEVYRRLPSLPKQSIIFTPGVVRDGAGESLVPVDVIAQISKTANRPVYAGYNTAIGHGAIGVFMPRIESIAQQASEIAKSLLAGKDPAQLSLPDKMVNQYIFDWRELKRFGVVMSHLPEESVIRYKDPSVFILYWRYFVAAALIFIFQMGLVLALLAQRRIRAQVRDKGVEIERQRLQVQRLNRAQILQHFSGSIAHEINQPLGAMFNNTLAIKKLIEKSHPNDEIKEILEDLLVDNRRTADIIVRLRGWLKKEEQKFSDHHVNDIVQEVVDFLKSELLFNKVECTLKLQPSLPQVFCDKLQIQQVLVNLIKNAYESNRQSLGADRIIVLYSAPSQENKIAISVQDDGDGIADHVIKDIFRPFYTTKKDGIGLGLSISQSIIENHRGRLWAERNPSRGMTFHFTLPVSNESAS